MSRGYPKQSIDTQTANDLVGSIFSKSKSRTTFNVDFAKLSRQQKTDYIRAFFNRNPFTHQEEIIDVLTESMIRNTTLNASRQSGKSESVTWAQALNAIHNLYPALDNTTKIISLANKESQSLIIGNRLRNLLEENWDNTQYYWDQAGSVKKHLVFKREAGVNSKTTGTIDYLTANPNAFGEGFTASEMFIDEAGRLDLSVFSQVIVPYGASTNAKLNLTGVSRGRGPFYDACNSHDYHHLHYPWDKVETYRRSAPVNLKDRYTGETILETGMYPLRVMPLSLKKVLFPTNPICHVLPVRFQKEDEIELWELSEGIMTEEDFRSQFNLEWIAALMAFLQLYHIQQLFESSEHTPLELGDAVEEYSFGFDLSGARNVYGSGRNEKDKAALAIWRRREGVMEKVFCADLYSAQPDEAVQWLSRYVHPQTGIFRCHRGAVDITGAVGAYTSEKLLESHLPVIPIMYNRTDDVTKKNYKNAMFDFFKIQVDGGRCRYPRKEVTDELDPDTLRPKNPTWYEARQQWEVIEREETGGLNAKIGAPFGEHDDYPNSDVLAVYALERGDLQFGDFLRAHKRRAVLPARAPSVMSAANPVRAFQDHCRPRITRL